VNPDEAPQSREETPARALATLAAPLRKEGTVISPHLVEPSSEPVLGMLAAAGPRAAAAPAQYAFVVEAVREGYLLHYGTSRLLEGHDPDLGLLAGDYLYALGIQRLAALGDTGAVRELSDLISISAEVHAEARPELAAPLWLAAALAVGCGSGPAHDEAKRGARDLQDDAGARLTEAAIEAASAYGLGIDLDRAAEGIDFRIARMDMRG
jgi:hypothetical protein